MKLSAQSAQQAILTYLLSLEDRVKPLLIKQLVSCQIKQVTNMLAMLSKIKTSYKTIERLYSDPEVMLICDSQFAHFLLEKKDITESNITGDGTGYSLTVKKNLMH